MALGTPDEPRDVELESGESMGETMKGESKPPQAITAYGAPAIATGHWLDMRYVTRYGEK